MIEYFHDKFLIFLDPGSCIVTYETDELCLNVAAWKGVRTVRAYTEVNDAVHNLRLLGADVSQYGKSFVSFFI